MSHNSFGHLFRVTTWGESHGPAIGCVVDGCPPRLALSEADIQPWLDRRRPGQSRFTTQRQEPDEVRILSGVFEGQTTGTPIALQIDNVDQRSKDYGDIAERFRPGPCRPDLRAEIRHPRLSRRRAQSRRARRPCGWPPARWRGWCWARGVRIRGALVQMGPHGIDRARWDWDAVDGNPFFCPDPVAAAAWEDYLDGVRKAGSSCGAVIEVVAEGVPPGLGAPVYGKLDADLAAALMGINAVKGVEIGDGFAAAALTGEENADEMRMHDGRGGVRLQPCRRHPGRHFHRPAGRGALRGEADQFHPDAARRGGPAGARGRGAAPRGGTIRASASAPCRWARRWWPACWPTICCATARRTRTRPTRRGCPAPDLPDSWATGWTAMFVRSKNTGPARSPLDRRMISMRSALRRLPATRRTRSRTA